MFHEKVAFDNFTADLIRRKARQLVGRSGFTKSDVEDIAQELSLKLIKHLGAFDPEQGHARVFVTTVIERQVATLLRDKRAAKRDFRRVSSLNVATEDEGEQSVELRQTISTRVHDARLGRDYRGDIEIAQLVLDMTDLIATLPPSWQTLLELRKTCSMREAADKMGVPRTTLNDWMRRIRKRFENIGMRDYLI